MKNPLLKKHTRHKKEVHRSPWQRLETLGFLRSSGAGVCKVWGLKSLKRGYIGFRV